MKVPIYKQKRNTCGPTALRMVLAYFGRSISEAEIIKIIGGIKLYGSQTIKLAQAAEKLGFKTVSYSFNKLLVRGKAKIRKPNIQDVMSFLKKRTPVILAVRSSLLYREKLSEEGHFIVITGYKGKRFFYNDPYDGKRHTIALNELLFAWYNNVINSSAYLLVVWPKK